MVFLYGISFSRVASYIVSDIPIGVWAPSDLRAWVGVVVVVAGAGAVTLLPPQKKKLQNA